MITYYLRFPSQDDWEQAAAAIGLRVNNPILIEDEKIDPDTGEIIPPVYEDNWSWLPMYTHDWAIDDVGVIYNDDAVVDPDGTVVTPATPMAGWHVNFVGVLPDWAGMRSWWPLWPRIGCLRNSR
jgi:hypothetical protein